MQSPKYKINCLVQYKNNPAKVTAINDKIEILLGKNTIKRVREKDILLIHQGPTNNFNFADLAIPNNSLMEAHQLLQDETCNLSELTELIFGDNSPAFAWSCWKMVQSDLFFSGNPEQITPNSIEYANNKLKKIAEAAKKKQEEDEFWQRIKAKKLTANDFNKITDVEELALLKRNTSLILKKLGLKQNPNSAHRFLCEVGRWHKYFNPILERFQIKQIASDLAIPDYKDEPRRNLTHLTAWAIDDEGNTDPDDAISIDGDKIWVHIADVSSIVTPGSQLDQNALDQMSNIYLPETTIHMLPPTITEILGLGLNKTSPALSIGFGLTDNGIENIEICLTNIAAKRISYSKAQDEPELEPFFKIANKLNKLRQNSVSLQFPEVKLKIDSEHNVKIYPIPQPASRNMVMEFMLAAGVAASQFALINDIPFVFSSQALADFSDERSPDKYSAMVALRRKMTRSLAQTTAEPHDGLGLTTYSQVTSPLRRYVDLINHQQLRAHIHNRATFSVEELNSRLNKLDIGRLRKVERESELHWKCVYLLQNKNWQGIGFITEIDKFKTSLIIPQLALEIKILTKAEDRLDQQIKLKLAKVDLFERDLKFRRV